MVENIYDVVQNDFGQTEDTLADAILNRTSRTRIPSGLTGNLNESTTENQSMLYRGPLLILGGSLNVIRCFRNLSDVSLKRGKYGSVDCFY